MQAERPVSYFIDLIDIASYSHPSLVFYILSIPAAAQELTRIPRDHPTWRDTEIHLESEDPITLQVDTARLPSNMRCLGDKQTSSSDLLPQRRKVPFQIRKSSLALVWGSVGASKPQQLGPARLG